MKNIIQQLKIIVLALIIGLGAAYAMAWTGPTAEPPLENVAAPISEGSSDQFKEGSLTLGKNLTIGGYSVMQGIFETYNDTYLATKGGNVGIGTADPDFKLHVSDRMKLDGSDAGMWIEAGANDWFVGRSNSNLRFYNAGDRVTITPGGNVGIGRTSPTQKLDVAGNVKGNQLCIGSDCRSSWPGGVVSGVAVYTVNGECSGDGYLTTAATCRIYDYGRPETYNNTYRGKLLP